MVDNIIDVSEATFEFDVIQRSHEIPVVVDFWAPWCGPCRMLGPMLEKLADHPEYEFILAKVNVDENPTLSMQYQVQGIPAVKAFRNGRVVAEFTGAQPLPKVQEFIKQVAPSEIDQALAQAQSLLATRHWAAAEQAFRNLLLEYSDHQVAMLNLARALLAQGKGCEAIGYLQDCTDGDTYQQATKLMPLAEFLCRALTEKDSWEDEKIPTIEAQYRQTAHLLTHGNFAAAMDGLLEVLRQDKRYRKGEPREVMLGLFELLGDTDPLTQKYRRELASVLF